MPRELRLCRRALTSHLRTAPFSVSACACIRQRPVRRQLLRPARDTSVQEPKYADSRSNIGDNPSPVETLRPVPTLSHITSPTSKPKAASHDPAAIPQDTSTSGPYKQILLASRSIRHVPSVNSHSQLTARTTRSQIQQLSAAEKFFAPVCKFLYSAEALHHHAINTHTPEIVVLGASNVGKSTFLNALVGQSKAARVSQKPGRTTLMNAYGIGPLPKIPMELVPKGMPPPRHSLVVVDTPGYGFRSQASWGDSIMKYLQARRMLRGAVVLISSEKRLLPEDKWMLRTLAEANTRTVVVLTKADKARSAWADKCSLLANTIQQELNDLNEEFGGRWREGIGAAEQIYITAAGMESPGKLKNGGGMGGVRTAILETAGFKLEETVTKKAETVTYTGPVVSFDDIQWKT